MDGDLLTKIFFGGISGIVFVIVLSLTFGRKDKTNKKHPISSTLTKMEPKPFESNSFLIQKATLDEMKQNKLLTEVEYKQKVMMLESKERDRIIQQLDNQSKLEIEPFIKQLTDLVNSGILSKEEFLEKKEILYKNKLVQLKSEVSFKEYDTQQDLTQKEKSIITLNEITSEILESSTIRYFWGKRREFKIKYSDGKIGYLYFSESMKKYYIITGLWTAYYIDREAAIKALYVYLIDKKVLKEGRYYYG